MTFFELLTTFVVNGLLLAGFWVVVLAIIFAFLSVKDLHEADELFPEDRRRGDNERRTKRIARLEHDLSMCSDDCEFCQD